MELRSDDLVPGQRIAERFCFGRFDPEQHVALADNVSPHLAWSSLPSGTRSLALICVDPDVPSQPDDVNKDDREVPSDLPRVDFYHWSLIDLSPDVTELARGAFSRGITPRGKRQPPGPDHCRQGLNNYTQWFADDADMAGEYFGYDGPCPPWNDSLVHHYHFRLYALDCEHLELEGPFNGEQAEAAARRHQLDLAELIVTYTLNPRLRD